MKPSLQIYASVLTVLVCLVCAGALSNDTSETAATNRIVHSSRQFDDALSWYGTGVPPLASPGHKPTESAETSTENGSLAHEARLLPDNYSDNISPSEKNDPAIGSEKPLTTKSKDSSASNKPAGKRNKKQSRNKNTTTTTTISSSTLDDIALIEIDNDVTESQQSQLIETATVQPKPAIGPATFVAEETELDEPKTNVGPTEIVVEPTPNVDDDYYDVIEPVSYDNDEPHSSSSSNDNSSNLLLDLDEASIEESTTQRFVRANASPLRAQNLVLESPTDLVPESIDDNQSTTAANKNNDDEMFYDDQPKQDEYLDELLPPDFRCEPTDQCGSSEDLTMSLSSSSGSVVPAGITMILRCEVVTSPEVPAEVTWHAPRRVAHRIYVDEPEGQESARRQAAVNATTERVQRTRTGKHPGERLITTSILTVPNATEADGGAHVCSARLARRCCHRNGTVAIRIYVPPSYATDLTVVGAVCFVEFLIILYFKTRADRRDGSCSHRGSLANGVHAAQHNYEPLEQEHEKRAAPSKKELEEI